MAIDIVEQINRINSQESPKITDLILRSFVTGIWKIDVSMLTAEEFVYFTELIERIRPTIKVGCGPFYDPAVDKKWDQIFAALHADKRANIA